MSAPIKCVVWDLDGTLWEGAWSEQLEAPAWRAGALEALWRLDELGVLQSVVSRAPRSAWASLEAAGVAELFLAPVLGCEGSKSSALLALAGRLDLGLEGFVFVDDAPFERAEVEAACPGVRCVDGRAWSSLWSLDGMPQEVTAQGQARRSQYKAREARAEQERSAQGPPDAFLRGLGMELRVWRAREEDLGRLGELMERTRQWNTTGLRLEEGELRARLSDAGWWVCAASLQDRFGDDGLCAVSVAQREQDAWVARLWAVSCRVQNRGVGAAFLGWLIEQARAQGLGFGLELRRTERNRPLSVLLRVSGFEGGAALAGVEVLRWPASLAAPSAPWVRVLDEAP